MPIEILEQTSIIEAEGWVARVHPPKENWNGRIILLLHGWTGDERTMWIFARKLPTNSLILAPRGPHSLPEGGFAWAIPQNGRHPDVSPFLESAGQLLDRLPIWIPEFQSGTRLDVVGFSQGAAMTYALCLKTSPVKIAPMAGYLPEGFASLAENRSFSHLNVFIAHNTDDSMVSVDESHRAADFLTKKGAAVQFCETNGGHKVSLPCINRYDEFMRD